MVGEWLSTTFEQVCTITRGASPRPIGKFYAKTGVPWIKISDATGVQQKFINKTACFIKEEGRSKSVEVFPGDLIVSNSATPGLPRFVMLNACIHDGWLLLRDFKGLDPDYAFYLVLQEGANLTRKGNGSIFVNLKTDILKTHSINLPPLEEQKRIAHLLGSLDDKIELNRKMNETLEEMAQAIFKSWFVDFDGVAEEDLVESELGLIPDGWEVKTLKEEFHLTMGQSPPGDTYNEEGKGIPFFQGCRDFSFRFPSKRVYCTAPKRFADVGDTLISVRAPVGQPNMALFKCCIGRGVAAMRHKSTSVSYTYAMGKHLERQFEVFNGEGTVFGSISKKDFENLKVVKPPESLVEEFTKVCGEMDNRIQVNEEQSQTLSELRDTLLPKLLSGELRIPEAEEQVSELIPQENGQLELFPSNEAKQLHLFPNQGNNT